MKKCVFIFNPHTGGGRLRGKLMEIICMLSAAGYELSVYPTAARGNARTFAMEKGKNAHLVVCCGGDGTLNETVDGLMQLENRPLLGYIPGGTTNDFASSLTLPKTDMIKAAKRIISPKKEFEFDVGSFNEQSFNYVAAFGAFTDVSYTTPQAFKNLLGYFAYIAEGVQRLPNLKTFHAKLSCCEESIEDEFLFGMVANSTSVGGFQFGSTGKVRLDDGRFEMLMIRKPNSLSELSSLSASLITRNLTSPYLIARRITKLEVISKNPIPWTIDGEFGGEHSHSLITVNQKALRICI